MKEEQRQMLAVIARKAEQDALVLAGEFARAAAQDREAILAGLEFERWLAESCWECLEDR